MDLMFLHAELRAYLQPPTPGRAEALSTRPATAADAPAILAMVAATRARSPLPWRRTGSRPGPRHGR